MPVLRPKPGDILTLPVSPHGIKGDISSNFRFAPLPQSPQMVFKMKAGQATIYQMLDDNQNKWAMKVFLPNFRTEKVISARERLKNLVGKPGLAAATRIVFTKEDEIVGEFGELEYAVLMPWILGQTCFDMYTINAKSPTKYTREEVVTRSRDVITVIGGLEKESYTHTDVSSGNLIFSSGRSDRPSTGNAIHGGTQLIDLEDIYFWGKGNGAAEKAHYTTGYGHPSLRQGATTACPAGDRYATIILVAEILMLSEPDLASKVTADGYFLGDITDPTARERYETAQRRLKQLYPAFADALADAWRSKTLEDCSEIHLLLPTLERKPPPPPPGSRGPDIFDAPPLVAKPVTDAESPLDPLPPHEITDDIFDDSEAVKPPGQPQPDQPTLGERLSAGVIWLINALKGLINSILGR